MTSAISSPRIWAAAIQRVCRIGSPYCFKLVRGPVVSGKSRFRRSARSVLSGVRSFVICCCKRRVVSEGASVIWKGSRVRARDIWWTYVWNLVVWAVSIAMQFEPRELGE